MYCSICVEVCPFDALHWSPEFEYSELDIRELTHEKDRLREWMWTVPAPTALDENAEPAKEISMAEKAAERAAAQQAPPRTAAQPVQSRPESDPPPGGGDA
jgi:NADH-quinone oxidoreductase subunit I